MLPKHNNGSGASRRCREAVLTRGADLVTRRVSLNLEEGQVLSSVWHRPLIVYYYAVSLLITIMLCSLRGRTYLIRDLFLSNNNNQHLSQFFLTLTYLHFFMFHL